MLPTTHERVRANTADVVNQRIERQTEARVRQLAGQPAAIARRLDELDREWDIERVLETNASTLAFAGIVLAATHDRRWLIVPGVVTAFLFQHALQGWCPPLPILRHLGFRTAGEIARERVALKALRGDFARVADAPDPASAALAAARA